MNGTQDAGRDQFLTNAFLPSFRLAGAHQVKAGVDLDRITYGQNLNRTGYEYLRSDGSPVRRVLYEGSGVVARSGYEASAYVQDAWRIRKDVLIEAGVRSDWDSLVRNWNWSPRFGVAWSPSFLRDTKVSGGFGILYDAANLTLFTRPMDQYPVTYLYPPFAPAMVPLRSSFYNPGSGFASPRYVNASAAVDRRFGQSIFGRVDLPGGAVRAD